MYLYTISTLFTGEKKTFNCQSVLISVPFLCEFLPPNWEVANAFYVLKMDQRSTVSWCKRAQYYTVSYIWLSIQIKNNFVFKNHVVIITPKSYATNDSFSFMHNMHVLWYVMMHALPHWVTLEIEMPSKMKLPQMWHFYIIIWVHTLYLCGQPSAISLLMSCNITQMQGAVLFYGCLQRLKTIHTSNPPI